LYDSIWRGFRLISEYPDSKHSLTHKKGTDFSVPFFVVLLFVQIKITGDMASYHKVIGGGNFAVAVAIRGQFG